MAVQHTRRVPREAYVGANAARTRQAAARTVAHATAVLNAETGLTPREDEVLRARVRHPDDTLHGLALRLGMTKDAYAAALRRALEAHPVP